MPELTPAQLAQLTLFRQLREQGTLPDEAYHTALAGLGIDTSGGDFIAHDKVIQGDVVRDSGRKITLYFNRYEGPPPQDAAEALAIYRRVLAGNCGRLPLRGLAPGAGDPTSERKPLELAHVYIDLNTKTPVAAGGKSERERARVFADEREMRALRALEAAVAHRRLALTGDPGSGKTTFVRHLAYCLALHVLQPNADWLNRLPDWPQTEAEILPILITLRDFARGLPDPLPSRAEPRHLWKFIRKRLRAQNLTFAAKPIRQTLEQGGALVLLDGLDEVTTVTQRVFVRDAVAAFVSCYPDNRYLATCRVLSYQPPPADSDAEDLRLREFPAHELALFDEERIDRFIEAWYTELTNKGAVLAEKAQKLTQKLKDAVRLPDMWRLAPNPLLLTVMAIVHADKGQLPGARAKLYEEIVDILLWRWEQVKTDETPPLQQLLQDANRDKMDLKRVLRQLAYEAHAELDVDADRDQLADIGEAKLLRALAALNAGSRDWAAQVVHTMKERAGLLVERDPMVFTFPHRTFQEYLAGAYLARQPKLGKQSTKLAAQGAVWREVILLAAGHLVYVKEEPEKPLLMVGELCPAEAADDAESWRKAWLAGEVLLEMKVNRVADSATGQDLLKRVRERLADLLKLGRLTPRERAEAGVVLAALGDPRDFDELVTVEEGRFWMGDDESREAGERPRHKVWLDEFQIGKYPVTNAQYLDFVNKTGREWRGLDEARRPERTTCPARYVSWYDAQAYCEWLTKVWKKEVRLLTEAEWERAARGMDGWVYPWGNDWDKTKCNSHELGLGDTTPVGIFPEGARPAGCLDMAGNVWEWVGDWYAKDYYGHSPRRNPQGPDSGSGRVVRGGAFSGNLSGARCACRYGDAPRSYWLNCGFRVVVPPISPPAARWPAAR